MISWLISWLWSEEGPKERVDPSVVGLQPSRHRPVFFWSEFIHASIATYGRDTCISKMTYVLVCARSFSRIWLFVTTWTVAHQAPLSMGFSRQELLEWAAMPSSRGSSRPRDRTHVSYISYTAGRFLTAEPLGSIDFPQQENWGIHSLQLGSSLIHRWALFSEHYIWCWEEAVDKFSWSCKSLG